MAAPPLSASAQATIQTLLNEKENLRRELLLKDNEAVKLRRLLDEKEARKDEAVKDRTAASREAQHLRADLTKAQKEISILKQEKATLDAAALETASYVRKLESKLTGNGKDFLLTQNVQLKSALEQLRGEHEALVSSASAQKSELERAMREIEVLVSGSVGVQVVLPAFPFCVVVTPLFLSPPRFLLLPSSPFRPRRSSCVPRSSNFKATCARGSCTRSRRGGRSAGAWRTSWPSKARGSPAWSSRPASRGCLQKRWKATSTPSVGVAPHSKARLQRPRRSSQRRRR